MKTTVAITGWNVGLQKVSMTHVIQNHAAMTPAEAKQCTDDVLEGRTVLLPVASSEDAAAFCAALIAIGARAELRDAI